MDYTKLRDQVREMESRQAAMTPSAADTPVIPPKEGLFTSIAKGAGGFAKELYKGVVRPLATPFAGLQAGITGEEVQYSDWLGGARGSNDPAKQAKIAGGAALEAASLIPAGKGLAAMRGLKGLRGKELAKFALMEARYGAKTGAAGGAGYELGQNEDSTLDSVITSGIVGAGFGGVLGFGLPYGGKLAGYAYGKLPSSWRKGVDDVVDNYLARQAAKTKSKTGGIPPPPDGGGGAAGAVEKGGLPDGATLADIDSDLFPTKAPDAVSVDLKLADKAKRSGIKTADINMFGEMSATERQQARQMIEMADAKVESHSAPHPQIIPGKPVLNQVKRLEAVAKQSGKRLGEIADEMPNQAIPLKTTRIDENGFEHTIDPLGRMLGWLDDSKVRIRKDKAGNIVGLNFDNSAYRGSPFATERAMIEQSFQELFPAQAKGLDIHRTPKEIMQIRRTLREYRMKVEAKLGESTNPVETMIENLRRDLLEPIGAVSDDFRKVNQTYAVSKSARDKFYKDFLGKKFTEATPGELQERIGEVLRRLASNTSATPGMNLRMLREAIEKTYKLTGEEIPEGLLQDPRRLTFLSELINDAWDIKAPTGFQGSIERGIASTIGQGVEIAQDVGQIATGRPISGGLSLLRKVGLGKDPKVARQQLLKDIFKATEEIPLPKGEAVAAAEKTAEVGINPNTLSSSAFDQDHIDRLVERLRKGEKLAPIALDEANLTKVLDGNHRLAAYKMLGEQPEFVTINSKEFHRQQITNEDSLKDIAFLKKHGKPIKTTQQLKKGYKMLGPDDEMAAATAKTAKPPSNIPDGEYVYHTTSPDYIPKIAKSGMKPSEGQYGKGVYFAPNQELTGGYGSPGGATIRVKRTNLPEDYQEFKGDQGWTNQIVTPDKVEVSLDKGATWKSLAEKQKPTAKTAVTGQAEKIGGQEAMGAMAGLEPEYDEDGKIKGFKFNPEKAALGMAGMIVGKKAVHFSKMKHIEAPWEKGILRAELSDKTATIKPLKDWALKAGYTWLHNGRINEPAFLQDVLEHTKLYDEYPELKNVMFKMNPKLAKNSGFWDGKAINISDEMDEKAIKPLVLHETQHIIQDMESFAKGGSVDELTKNPDLQRAVIGRMLKDSIELSKTHSEITTKDLDKIFQLYQKANSGEVVPMKDLRELVDTDEGIIEYYHRLAGEWEARRVAQRSEFSQQQLAKRPFYSFFDSDVKSPEDIITLER